MVEVHHAESDGRQVTRIDRLEKKENRLHGSIQGMAERFGPVAKGGKIALVEYHIQPFDPLSIRCEPVLEDLQYCCMGRNI